MKNNREWQIKQIIPAPPGWKAVHCSETENGEVVMYNRAIVCWALVEELGVSEGGRTQVRGMEQRFDDLIVVDDAATASPVAADGAHGNEYFLGYDDPDAHRESQFWLGQANRRLKREKEKLTK
ncbi:MAG TPA: hypothetical protein VIH18_25165 [Candidatus Binatia bacterium]|jgi:hypothetical protein